MYRPVPLEFLATERLLRLSGPVVTLFLIVVVHGFAVRLPALPLLLTLAIAYSVLLGGIVSAAVSALVSIAYATYAYQTPGAPFHYAPDNFERLVIFVAVVPLVVAVLGSIRKRLDTLLARERHLRLQAEAEHDRAASILESITDGFFALDGEWRYVYVNHRAEQLVGQPREALLGKVLWEAFPALVGSVWDREYHRAVDQRVAVHFEEFYAPLNTWFETHAYPAEDGLTIYMRSVTDRKRAEEALAARARQQAALAALGQQQRAEDAVFAGQDRHFTDIAVHGRRRSRLWRPGAVLGRWGYKTATLTKRGASRTSRLNGIRARGAAAQSKLPQPFCWLHSFSSSAIVFLSGSGGGTSTSGG